MIYGTVTMLADELRVPVGEIEKHIERHGLQPVRVLGLTELFAISEFEHLRRQPAPSKPSKASRSQRRRNQVAA